MKKIKEMLKNDWLILAILILSFILGAIFYKDMPDKVPNHWNFKGEVDGWGGKFYGAFGTPLIGLGIYVMMVALPYIDPRKKNYDNFFSTYKLYKYIFVFYILAMHLATIAFALGYNFDMSKMVMIFIAILFMALGNSMGKIKQNYFMGIRTPWTIDNEEVWRRTHRLAAPLWTFGGFIFLLTAVLGFPFFQYVFLVVLTSVALIPVVYSYFIHRKLTKGSEK